MADKKSPKPRKTGSSSYTYKDAGVDIEAGNRLISEFKPIAAATARPGADASLGGFGALFDLKALNLEDPVLVATTYGVGTKLKIALELRQHRGIGIDLVAMCVNDLIAQGAEPLFLLDYIAMGKIQPSVAVEIVSGIADGCRQAGCALIGGETAEMPGLYREDDYDLAGFAVGAVERDLILPRQDIAEGDVLLGIASSGLHSNGFSLLRKLIDDSGLSYWNPAPFDETRKLGDYCIEPTRIYVKSVLGAIRAGKVRALAHITGGGITENLPRVLPKGTVAHIDLEAWSLPPIFAWLQEIGALDRAEMLRTLNCGIGMAVVASPDCVPLLKKSIPDSGDAVYEIGHIERASSADRDPSVRYSGRLRS